MQLVPYRKSTDLRPAKSPVGQGCSLTRLERYDHTLAFSGTCILAFAQNVRKTVLSSDVPPPKMVPNGLTTARPCPAEADFPKNGPTSSKRVVSTPLRHLCDTFATPLRRLCDTLQHLCDTFATPLRHLWARWVGKTLVSALYLRFGPVFRLFGLIFSQKQPFAG